MQASDNNIMSTNNFISKYISPLSPIPTSLQQSGQIKEPIKCILFDIYGTLFISGAGDISISKIESRRTEKLEQLLLKSGKTGTPKSLLKDLSRAIETRHAKLRKKGVDFPEVEIDRVWMHVLENKDLKTVRRFAVEFELILNPVYPMPHLKELLSACNDLNILMGIISNAQFYTPYLFNWFLNSGPEDLGFHPDIIFYSYEFGYAKPSGFLFQNAVQKLKKMNIPAHAALYIGNDMLNDIYPAKKAGFKTGLFAGDDRSLRLRKNDPECKNLSADIVITDLIQLLDYVV